MNQLIASVRRVIQRVHLETFTSLDEVTQMPREVWGSIDTATLNRKTVEVIVFTTTCDSGRHDFLTDLIEHSHVKPDGDEIIRVIQKALWSLGIRTRQQILESFNGLVVVGLEARKLDVKSICRLANIEEKRKNLPNL